MISVGDNFYEDGVSSVDDSQRRTSFEGVYAVPAVQVPWYSLLGNHAYRGCRSPRPGRRRRRRASSIPPEITTGGLTGKLRNTIKIIFSV